MEGGHRVSKAVKERMIAEFRDRYASVRDCVVCGYQGTDAQEFVKIRDALAAKGIDMHVVHNRLAGKALAEAEGSMVTALLDGPCAIATADDVDPVELVKALVTEAGEYQHLRVQGALVEGELLDEVRTAAVSKIPPRDILYATIAGAMAAPARHIAGAFASIARSLCYAMSGYKDKLAEESS